MKGKRRLLRPGKRVVHMPLLLLPKDDAVAECLVEQQADTVGSGTMCIKIQISHSIQDLSA